MQSEFRPRARGLGAVGCTHHLLSCRGSRRTGLRSESTAAGTRPARWTGVSASPQTTAVDGLLGLNEPLAGVTSGQHSHGCGAPLSG